MFHIPILFCEGKSKNDWLKSCQSVYNNEYAYAVLFLIFSPTKQIGRQGVVTLYVPPWWWLIPFEWNLCRYAWTALCYLISLTDSLLNLLKYQMGACLVSMGVVTHKDNHTIVISQGCLYTLTKLPEMVESVYKFILS